MLDVHRKCNGNGNDPRAACCDSSLMSYLQIYNIKYRLYMYHHPFIRPVGSLKPGCKLFVS